MISRSIIISTSPSALDATDVLESSVPEYEHDEDDDEYEDTHEHATTSENPDSLSDTLDMHTGAMCMVPGKSKLPPFVPFRSFLPFDPHIQPRNVP